MKKTVIFLITIAISAVFAWSKTIFPETKILNSTIGGLQIIYNVNGDILYLDDIINHLETIKQEFGIKNNQLAENYPIDLKELRYHLLYEPYRKIEAINDALEMLEYLATISSVNYSKTENPAKKKEFYLIFKTVQKDFQALLKMSMRYAKDKNDLYSPKFMTLDAYKKYFVTPAIYYFVYFTNIVPNPPSSSSEK